MSVAPPKWAKRVQFRTARGKTDPGAKLLWLELWSYAPLDRAKDDDGLQRDPVAVWPSRRMLAESLGEDAETIKRWLSRVYASGWARRVGTRIELAVFVPFFVSGTVVPWSGMMVPGAGTVVPGDSGPRGGDSGPRAPGIVVPGAGTVVPPEDEKKNEEEDRKEDEARARQLDLASQHEAIAAQQARLAEERRKVREESQRDPANAVTHEYVAAIRGAGPAWALLLEHDVSKRYWQRDLGKLIAELGLTADPLTPDQVGAVLRAWNAEAERHGDREVEAGHVRGVPPRQWIWKPQHRAWVLGKVRRSPPPREPRPRTLFDNDPGLEFDLIDQLYPEDRGSL